MSMYKTFEQLTKIAAKLKPQMIALTNIVAAKDTQQRAKIDTATVESYRRAYQGEPLMTAKGEPRRDRSTGSFIFEPNAEALPPILVCPAADHQDYNPDDPAAQRYYQLDGDHRTRGAVKAGLAELPAIVLPAMTLQEAQFASVGANATHGLNRNSADKRHALKTTLALTIDASATARKNKQGEFGKITYKGTLPNGDDLTVRNLATVAGVSHQTASEYLRDTLGKEYTDEQKPDPKKGSKNGKGGKGSDKAPKAPKTDAPDAPEVDQDAPRDLTAIEPTEYAHGIIRAAEGDRDWLMAVAEVIALYLANGKGKNKKAA